MGRLAAILFFVIGTSLAGSFIVAGLTMGYDTTRPILIAAVLGFALAIPVSIMVARAIVRNG